RPLVVDNGSHRVRFGWAGDFAPSATARNIVGRWRAEASEAWREALGSKFIGDVAIDRHATLNLHHPMRGGKITNWEAMRDVWDDVIDDDVDMTQHPILVTEQASIDKKQRERMAEVLFESLRFPAICLRNQSLLSAYSSNQSVSIVVNCGHDVTEVVPIYYDDVLRHAVTRMEVGGRNVGEYLAKLINLERGASLSTTPQMELVQSIKERFASVDHGVAGTWCCAVKNGAIDKIFELSDGQTIELGSELWRCSEVLFDPTLVSSASSGIHQLVATTISR
uniref:Actin-related protein 8 n=1 Tax=Ciona savignyi TaxID=51511 RepID=H2ZA61_CIOSA